MSDVRSVVNFNYISSPKFVQGSPNYVRRLRIRLEVFEASQQTA